MFVRLRISLPRMKLAASNFVRHFFGVQRRESHILGTLLPKNPKSDESATARVRRPQGSGCERCGGSACVDIGQSSLTYLLLLFLNPSVGVPDCGLKIMNS